MERSMMMLVNPAAGRATSGQALNDVIRQVCLKGWAPTIYYTSGPGTGTELAARCGGNYEMLVCFGGDGTLSDVIAGLMLLPEKNRPMLGYIPMGTANDVASTLKLPRLKPLEAVKNILNGTPMAYDVGYMDNGGYFTYIAAFGAFVEVSFNTDQELKNLLGHAAYVLSSISYLPKLKSYKVKITCDEGVFEEELVYGAVTNSTSVAGLIRLDRGGNVNLSDGKFELTLVRKPEQLGDLNSILNGFMTQNYSGPCLKILQTSFVRFEFEEPVAWTRDGENGGEHSVMEITNMHSAVNIVC